MTAPTVHTDMGVAWITRGADGIHIEPEEIPAVVAALLVEHDRLMDAADGVMLGQMAETAQSTYGMCLACRSIEVALVEVIGTRDFSNIGESASYPAGYGCEVCS